MKNANCQKKLACGHQCKGFYGEEQCLPCLNAECIVKANEDAHMCGDLSKKQDLLLEGIDEDSYCTICWVSGLGTEPCIRLGCGHVFHLNCVKSILENRWTSPRITFGFMNCPSCKQPMELDHCQLLRPQL